jgi:hypothetical protein
MKLDLAIMPSQSPELFLCPIKTIDQYSNVLDYRAIMLRRI